MQLANRGSGPRPSTLLERFNTRLVRIILQYINN